MRENSTTASIIAVAGAGKKKFWKTCKSLTTKNQFAILYLYKNGKHYIIYDEVNEGFSETTRNIIKLNDDFMDITRRGVSNVHMMFEKNRKNVTYYYTPYGSLLIGIDAKSVDVQETENDIDVKVNYELEVNYEHMADCCITMNIKSKDAGDFRITGAE